MQKINKINKVLLTIMLIFVSVMPMNSLLIYAATKNVSYRFVSGWTQEGSNKWGDATIISVDGQPAFCIDSRYSAKEGSNTVIKPTDIGYTDATMEKLSLIAWYGYRDRGKNDTNYLLTQNVIWQYLKKDGQQFVSSKYPYKGTNMQKFYNDVMNKVNHFNDKPSFHAKTYTGEKGKALTITDTKKVLSGLRIKSVTGGKATKSGNNLTITPDGTKSQVVVTFDRGMTAEQTKTNFIVRGTGKDAYGNPYQPVSTLTGKDPYNASVRVNVIQKGHLSITKQDEDGNKVPNTSFKLSKNSNMSSPLGTYTTGSNGSVVVKDLVEGTYYVQESAVPSHLVLDKTIHKVAIKAGQTASFTATNKYKQGKLKIKKESSLSDITDGNSSYNLAGAEYGVYKDKDTKQFVDTLTIGEDGWSQELSLRVGTYYIKELKAPEGYLLNGEVVEAKVEADKTTSLSNGTFKDTPQSQALKLMLQKIDADTHTAKPQGDGTFKDAEFTVKYYGGSYEYGVDPGLQGIKPTRTWVFKTNDKGEAYLNKDHLISGDELYLNTKGEPVLPLGTITLQETKAPDGYRINEDIFIKKITSDGTQENVETFGQVIEVPENVIKLHLTKYQKDKVITVSDVSFTHMKPDGSAETVVTDDKGTLELLGLHKGIHSIKEIAVKPGYELNATEVQFEVLTDGSIKVLTDLSNTGISFTEKNKDGYLEIEDEVSNFSFEINKVNTQGKLLDGAEFTLYADAQCKDVIQTLSTIDGKLQFQGLKDRTHYYLKETKAPDGYRIPVDEDGNVHVFDIYVESVPEMNQFDVFIDGKKYTESTNDDVVTIKDRNITLKVINKEMMKLPNTGSDGTLIYIGLGLVLASTGSALRRKYKKKEKNNVKK